MPASDPQGEMQFWDKGMPSLGIAKGSNDGGEMQFWFKGFPFQYLFPVGGSASLIKTVNGVAIASVSKIGELAIASVKNKNGVLNV